MTEPPPLPTDPLLTLVILGRWAQETPLADPDFAELVIATITTLLRNYGDPYWVLATLPDRARDIAYFTARNYYLNPDLVRQESTGPIQTTLDNKVLQGIDFTEDQIREIQSLATVSTTSPSSGLWAMSFTRGPVETSQSVRSSNIVLWDTRGGWPVEYLAEGDLDAFGLDET